MKLFLLIFLSLLVCQITSYCDSLVSDPPSDYRNSLQLSGRTLYRWSVDINNDGNLDILLDLKPKAEEVQMRGNDLNNTTRWFTAYVASGTQFVKSPYIQIGRGQIGEILSIKTDECYIGFISEIAADGIVSIERTIEKPASSVGGNIEVARIYAYTLDGTVVIKTKLAECDPDDSNPIYNKYLSMGHRSSVTLQEVAP